VSLQTNLRIAVDSVWIHPDCTVVVTLMFFEFLFDGFESENA
jgi:hypothetical protein